VSRICKHRRCAIDLDEIGKRPNADFCCDDCRTREWLIRKAEEDAWSEYNAKALITVSRHPRRATRDGVGTGVYLFGPEISYALAALRGEKRPRLSAGERDHFVSSLIRAKARVAT